MRTQNRRSTYERRAALLVHSRMINDVRPVLRKGGMVQADRARVPKAQSQTFASAPSAVPRPPQPVVNRSVPVRSTPPATTGEVPHVLHRRPHTAKRKLLKIQRSNLLTIVGLCIVLAGLGVGLYGFRANHDVAVQAKQLAHATDTPDDAPPSENKPTDSGAYRVAPDLPRTLSIPKLGVQQARVLRMGVDTSNQLKAPGNIFDTGWYDGSAKPGEAGAVLIDGHVSGPTQHGVFYDLRKLVAGDQIQLERGDGKVFTYKVVSSKTYDASSVDMAAALVPVTPGKPGLNLITCAGQLDSSKIHFNQRIIVFAQAAP